MTRMKWSCTFCSWSSWCFSIFLSLNPFQTPQLMKKQLYGAIKKGIISGLPAQWTCDPASRPCSWPGINCYLGGEIFRINFPSEPLGGSFAFFFLSIFSPFEGTIATEIGNLTYLNTIVLADNSMSGTIPTQIGRLTFLSSFLIYYSTLFSTIPTEVGNMKSLTTFLVQTATLYGTIPTEIGFFFFFLFCSKKGFLFSFFPLSFFGIILFVLWFLPYASFYYLVISFSFAWVLSKTFSQTFLAKSYIDGQ